MEAASGSVLKRNALIYNKMLKIKFRKRELNFQHFAVSQSITLQRCIRFGCPGAKPKITYPSVKSCLSPDNSLVWSNLSVKRHCFPDKVALNEVFRSGDTAPSDGAAPYGTHQVSPRAEYPPEYRRPAHEPRPARRWWYDWCASLNVPRMRTSVRWTAPMLQNRCRRVPPVMFAGRQVPEYAAAARRVRNPATD